MSDSYDLVIRNAHLITAADAQHCDIGIRDGRVAALATDLPPGAKEIDALGRSVTPGGVDGHCHLDQPMQPPVQMADGFSSGTRSAACGGTTTVIPFAAQAKGASLKAAIVDYHTRAKARAHIDYAFHMIVSDPTPEVIQNELPELISKGYTSFKLYMTYDDLKLNDRQIIELLDVAKKYNALPMIHAESSDCIEWLTERLESSGKMAPRWHAASRPMFVEREATHRAITFSELVSQPILIVHVSGHEAVEQIRWARARGLSVYSETCPQYLFLTSEDLGIDDSYDGARCVCSPPPRDRSNQREIWNAIQEGLFSIFSSDHAPFLYQGGTGKRPMGKEVPFRHIPNGIPGLETRLPLLYSEGVLTGRITPQRFVQLTSTNVAKLYGLYPKKGTIAIGSDADIVIWDNKEHIITNSKLHHAVDYTPYEGMKLQAWPAVTLSRGRVVWDGAFHTNESWGQFIQCDAPIKI